MSWQDITKEFFEEFGEYYVCAWWNGEKGARHVTSFITDRKAILQEYALVSPWPDGARFFRSREEAQSCLDSESELRPGLYDDWRVMTLAEVAAEFGHQCHPAIAIIGGRHPEHPEPREAAGAAPQPMAP